MVVTTTLDHISDVRKANYDNLLTKLEDQLSHKTKNQEEYNFMIYDYGDEIQIRSYTKPVKYGQGKKRDKPKIKTDKTSYSAAELESMVNSGKIGLMSKEMDSYLEKLNRSLSSSANRSKNKVYEYARANDWEYFVTLTFDPKKIDSTDYDLVTRKVSQWLKDMRKEYAPDLKYMMVPELHSDGKKYHFHALMSNIGDMKLVKSNVQRPSGIVYNFKSYKLGFTDVEEIRDSNKSSNYLSKYITKELCMKTPNKKRYWNSKNLNVADKTPLNLSPIEQKKLLDSFKNQVTHTNSVDVELDGYSQTITYYEISIPQD